MARKLAFVLALIGLCLATAVYALGLGNIQSESSLNEPLSARVPLLGVDADEATGISVDLASAEAFERAGIDRPFSLSRLKFEVKQGAQGTFIEITTKDPVKEPFLDFLLEVSWPQGRLIREYTLLLDPPTYAPGEETPSTQAPAVAAESTPAEPEPSASGERKTTTTTTGGAATTAGAPDLAEVSEVSEPSVGRYTVKANDTLWEVAQTLRPGDAVTINQTMLALFRENPDAFINSDMNRLKRGAVLRVPERGEIRSIPVADANAEVQRQIARWQRNRGVAGGSGATGGEAGRETAAADTARQAEGGELRVVAPESGTGEQPASSAQGEDGEALNRQVTLLKESNASLEAENEDLKAQVEALKREVSQLEGKVNVQAGQPLPGGEGQPESASTEQAPPEEEVAAEEMPSEEPAKDTAETGEAEQTEPESGEAGADVMAEAGSEEPGGEAPAEEASTESGAPDEEKGTADQAGEAQAEPEQATPAESPSEKKPEPKPKAEPKPQPRPEFTPTPIWQDPTILGLAGAVVLVLLLLVYMVMRRRGGGDDGEAQDLSDEIARGLEEDDGGPEAAGGFRDGDAEDETFAGLDEEPPELPPESDPLGEAEVYLAYGRYDQAQDVLERGLQREPDSKELRLKMLEVLALTQDRAAFEDQAQQLHTLVDEGDPAWQRALEMGREIAPEHPLFGAGGASPAQAENDEEDFGFDLSAPEEESTGGAGGASPEEPDKAAAGGDEFADFDFSFEDAETPATEEPSKDNGGDSGDFDLDFGLDDDERGTDSAGGSTGGDEPAAGLEDLQFDLDEPSPENPAAAPEPEPEQTAGGNDDLSLDFDLDEDQPMAEPARDEGELTGSESEEEADTGGLEDISFDFEEESEQGASGAEDDFEATTKDVDMQSTALDYNAEEPAGNQSAAGAGDDVDMLDEVGTKLDLARAYLDMGDNEGARALLDEVVEEGNDAQIKEARKLLSKAG